MNEKQLAKFQASQNKAIGRAIAIHVNGKIDVIDKKLTIYIEEDTKWKNDAQKFREEKLEPVVEAKANLSGFGKVAKGVLVGIALFGAAWAVIDRFIK